MFAAGKKGAGALSMDDGGDHKACLRCGKLMSAGARYCNSCGADLQARPTPGLQGSVAPAEFAASLQESRTPAAGTSPAALPRAASTPGPAPPPAAAPYGAPGPSPVYPYYPAVYAQRKTDDLAIASLVCAIASYILLPLVAAVAAIVTGFVSRERIRKSGGELTGDGLALAGILVGVSNVVFYTAILLIFILSAVSR